MTNWNYFWAPGAAGLTAAERAIVIQETSRFPSTWVPGTDGVLGVNLVEDLGTNKSAWIAGSFLVYMKGPHRSVSIGVTWHEMWHMGQLNQHIQNGGRLSDHSTHWPPFLFTPPSLIDVIRTERPEVEWEPTFIGHLMNPSQRVEAIENAPAVSRAAIAYMDLAGITVPTDVRIAVANAPVPAPGPQPPDTQPGGTLPEGSGDFITREEFDEFDQGNDSRHNVHARRLEHIEDMLGKASEGPTF